MFKFSELFKHSTKYPEKIQEIHKTVDMSSDKALEEARQILLELEEKSVNSKADRLVRLGFTGTKEAKEIEQLRAQQEKFKRIRDSIVFYQNKFPFNKFITRDEANAVCNKYNLYIGDAPYFSGFVPERNVQEMERFVENYTLTQYYKSPVGAYHSGIEITKEEYDACKNAGLNSGFQHYEHTPIFKIMAPETQFYFTNTMRKVGREIIDDPIVLYPVKEGFIVVTAWGDEASDPIVVNQINN